MNFQTLYSKRIELIDYGQTLDRFVCEIHRILFRLIPVVSAGNVGGCPKRPLYCLAPRIREVDSSRGESLTPKSLFDKLRVTIYPFWAASGQK